MHVWILNIIHEDTGLDQPLSVHRTEAGAKRAGYVHANDPRNHLTPELANRPWEPMSAGWYVLRLPAGGTLLYVMQWEVKQ